MGETAEAVGAVVAVLSLAGTIFYYAVIHPLASAITSLGGSITELRLSVQTSEEKRQGMDLRLAKVESSTASAHHRLDTLEERMNE